MFYQWNVKKKIHFLVRIWTVVLDTWYLSKA